MIKINIDHDNQGVASAVAGIIENALAQHGFTNVKGKIVMVTQELRENRAEVFMKKSQILPIINPDTVMQPKTYSTELHEARIAYGHPVILNWMKESHPDVFASPVLIDTGIDPTPYEEQLKAFKEGTDRG